MHRMNKRTIGVRLADLGSGAVALLVLLAFAGLALIGLFTTCAVEIGFSEDNSEHVAFLRDNPFLTLLAVLLLLFLLLLILRARIDRRAVRVVSVCALAFVISFGLWWTLSSRAVPQADSAKILEQARLIALGDAESMAGSTYFRVFPFQMGYLLYAEIFFRIFHDGAEIALAVGNVLCTAASYLCLILLTDRLFHDCRITLLAAVLLGLCWQPVFLCTFLYGVLPGLCAALWSAYFVVRLIQGGKWPNVLWAALLIAVAVTLKKNYMIVMIAECIVLVFCAMRRRAWIPVACAVALAALSIALPWSVQKGYERRAGASFGSGTPQSAWLVTGFRESSMCSGWFNSYTTTILEENGFDEARARAQIKADLSEQLSMFAQRPRYLASFLYHKVVSQWNEPAFQSIWSSQTGRTTSGLPAPVKDIYEGRLGTYIHAYFNVYVEFVYIGFALALALWLRKKAGCDEAVLLPLTVLGALLYHLLFEAKAQYALIYLPMMLPYAAYSTVKLKDEIDRLFFAREKKRQLNV